MPNTYTELLKTTVGTATSSVTLSLSGISGYTDLVLVANCKNTTGATYGLLLQYNGDTASNYSTTLLWGNGSSASSFRYTTQYNGVFAGWAGSTNFSPYIINIQNYANSTTFKTTLTRSSDAGDRVGAMVGLWRNTAAITSINISFEPTANIAVGSTFSLYGIANADQGAAKATGGIITEDSQYWYHTFGASGTFTPKQALTVDYLVVAGGGGGGNDSRGAGGGAGGFRTSAGTSGANSSAESVLSLASGTPIAVTVGAGGASGTGGLADSRGSSGSNSIFSTITSTAGGGGGGGATTVANGLTGGSGGGGGGYYVGTGGAGTSLQGLGGGAGTTNPNFGAGGGGGAGQVGAAGSGNNGGAGGNGIASTIIGTSVTYAGGGGGGSTSTGGAGGNGGGGAGGNSGQPGLRGTTNTGGGGGGTGDGSNAGAGGSGIVIIRYAK